jgi:beta-1,4-mannosyltransferase
MIEQAAQRDPRISYHFGFVPDEQLSREIRQAELVVLPYREMHNSGTLLLSLSLERPTLVPRTPVTSTLASEVGEAWVHQFEGPITTAVISSCVTSVRENSPCSPPALRERDWSVVGQKHQNLYREVAARHRRAGAVAPR